MELVEASGISDDVSQTGAQAAPSENRHTYLMIPIYNRPLGLRRTTINMDSALLTSDPKMQSTFQNALDEIHGALVI